MSCIHLHCVEKYIYMRVCVYLVKLVQIFVYIVLTQILCFLFFSQEAAAALAASDVAFMVQAAQNRGLQVTIATGTAATPAAPASTPGPAPSNHQVPIQ